MLLFGSSVRVARFPQAEYNNKVTKSAVAANHYLGGWHFPGVAVQFGWIVFLAKVSVFLFVYIWMRWTVPRYRYDQLMKFGWKYLFPASVLNLIATAALVLFKARSRAPRRSLGRDGKPLAGVGGCIS